MPAPMSSPLFAMYVQATRVHPTTKATMRKQWVVFPPFPEKLAKTVNMPATAEFLMFSRSQASPENRVKWKADWVATGFLERDLPERLEALKRETGDLPKPNQWEISPIITCQVPISEMATVVKDLKTPYKTLERLAKVARAKHRIAI